MKHFQKSDRAAIEAELAKLRRAQEMKYLRSFIIGSMIGRWNGFWRALFNWRRK